MSNLFRDQLDRYGEVAYVAKTWRRAIERLDAQTTLVLNADDPHIAALGRDAPGPVLYVGVDDPRHAGPTLEHTADARLCPLCGARLEYTQVYYGHIGEYRCGNCGFERPQPTIGARKVVTQGAGEMEATLNDGVRLRVPLPGLYNVYNALLALGVACTVGIERERTLGAIARFSAAFGRIERIVVEGRTVYMALVKNPVGFNQVLRSLLEGTEQTDLLIAINDNLADGTDVSWLWDVDVDAVRARAARVTVTGTRAEDMLLRLKYAEVPLEKLVLEKEIATAFDRALAPVPSGGTLFVTPTYTAMLELRNELSRRGLVAPFWED